MAMQFAFCLKNDFNEFLTQANCLVQHSTSLHFFFLQALKEGNSKQSYFLPKIVFLVSLYSLYIFLYIARVQLNG